MGSKAPEAFRTISEVSEILETPPHVLRFWESKFTQLKPVKRAGGRRYYRPADLELLAGIKQLLHEDGMTIRGVQKLLREQGVRHVAGLAPQFGTASQDSGPLGSDPADSASVDTGPLDPGRVTAPPAGRPDTTLQDLPESAAAARPKAPTPAPDQAIATDRSQSSPTRSDGAGLDAAVPHTAEPKDTNDADKTTAAGAAVTQHNLPFPLENATEAPSQVATHPLPANRLRAMRSLPQGARRDGLAATLERMRALHSRLRAAAGAISE